VNYNLGPVLFILPEPWRDDSTYQFLSPDKAAMILVEIAGPDDPADAESILAAALETHAATYESSIIYTKRFSPKPIAGMTIAAAEGERKVTDGSRGTDRFAFAAVEAGPKRALFTFSVPSRPNFMTFVRHVIESMTIDGPGADPAPPPPEMKRAQANFVRFAIPADWVAPDTLAFLHADSDRVALRVTIGEPPAAEGALDLAREIPGRVRIVTQSSAQAGAALPGARGWDAEWLVERLGPQPARVVVRKAVLELGRSTVTLYGQAPEPLGPSLAAGWASLRSTARSTGGR
jgi:hypothetical protein